jgi:ribosomal protein S18 acetylase RimI-like enzyme
MNYRKGNINDLNSIMKLALKTWTEFKSELTIENWQNLYKTLTSEKTFIDLLEQSYSVVCENKNEEIIGMSFLVPNGNPTEIYDKSWSYIRFVTVDPEFGGNGIGKKLTENCIEFAKQNGERIVALHTSEMMNKARHIYEKLGFEILRELEPRLGKKYWLYSLNIAEKE